MSGGAKPVVERAYMVVRRLAASQRRTPRNDRRGRPGVECNALEGHHVGYRPLSPETLRLTEKGAVFVLGPDRFLVHDRYASSHGPHADVVILRGSGCDDHGVRRSTRAVQVRDVERLIQAGCIATSPADDASGDHPAPEADHGGCPTSTSSDVADDG